MPRTAGSRNVEPTVAERVRLLATLRANASEGDSLACLALLLAQSPHARKESRHAPDPK